MNQIHTAIIADDDSNVRAALRRLFATARIPVENFASAPDLLAAGDLRAAAVLLLDAMMPGMSGPALQALLNETNSPTETPAKPLDNALLVERVRETFVRRADPIRRSQADHGRRLASLTPREREVYDLMINGNTSKMIARELGGSFRTVEIHRSRVMSKMQAANLADLVRMTFELEAVV